jgi:hypothetical protein
VVPRFVARRLDIQALGARRAASVIGGPGAMIVDRPGFTLEYAGRDALPAAPSASPTPDVLIAHRGHWRIAAAARDELLGPGDVALVTAGTPYVVAATMAGEGGLFRVRPTADPAGPTSGLGTA